NLRRSAAQLPGVEKAAVIDELPLTGDGGTTHVLVFGEPEPKPGQEQETVVRTASTDYFETLGIPLRNGRTFASMDSADSPKVVVINETLAHKLFGASNPVGRRLVMPFNKSEWDIVGVVSDVQLRNLDGDVRPTLYTTVQQDPSRSSHLVLKTAA